MEALLDAGRLRVGNLWVPLFCVVAAVLVGVSAVTAPLFGVAAIGAIAFVAVVFLDLAAGVCIFAILTFFERVPGLDAQSVTLIKGAGAVLALAWLLRVLPRNSRAPLLIRDLPVVGWSGLALATWAVMSSLWASDSGVALSNAFRIVQGVLLAFIVYTALQETRHLRWFGWAFCAGAFLTAIIGLAGVTAPEAHSAFEAARVTGGIGDANELAAILIPALALAGFAMSIERNVVLRWVQLVFVSTYVVALVRAESRGGFVGIGAMLLAALVFAGPARPRAVALIGIVAAVGITYYTYVAPPESLKRITNFSAGASSGRSDLWHVALAISGDHPVVGIGAGNFPLVEPRYALSNQNITRPDLIVGTPRVVHNTYLNVLVELGAIGLAMFSVFFVGALVAGWRGIRAFVRERAADAELVARGILVGTLGMLAAFVFLSAQYEKQLWLLLGVVAALSSCAARAARPAGA
jgi:putative inorganic carbon (hco3(-)) transporter